MTRFVLVVQRFFCFIFRFLPLKEKNDVFWLKIIHEELIRNQSIKEWEGIFFNHHWTNKNTGDYDALRKLSVPSGIIFRDRNQWQNWSRCFRFAAGYKVPRSIIICKNSPGKHYVQSYRKKKKYLKWNFFFFSVV